MLITANDIIKESYLVYKNNWRNLAVYVGLLLLPSLILSFLGVVGVYLSNYHSALTLVTNLVILAVFAASLIFSVWASIALTREMANLINHQTVNWKINFTGSSTLIWPVLYTSFFVGIIVFGGTLLLIVPGIIFAGWYMFATNSVILDGKKGVEAMRFSKDMVAGRWFAVVWRMLVPALVFALVVMALQYALILPVDYLISSPTVLLVLNPIINSVINKIFTPFAIAASLFLYFSVKANPMTK
ncbi:hypothetical protein KKA13_01145 [Patescibacteria group bacterium]|nr:hypothetical protein [Patescibacteria group bacterium]